nr:hypothetical protein [Tanacetum cinerariifolium]
MIESEAYKTYYVYATGEKSPKPKYVQKKADFETSPKKKPVQDPKGKRLKATTKVPKSEKKKLHAQGLETLLEITLSEAKQMKITTKRSRTQFHSSHACGSSTHEGIGALPWVLDVPTYGSDDEKISWKSNDDHELTESENDGDDFVHPKLSTFDKEERHEDKQDEEDEGSDLRVQKPSHFESNNDKAYDDITQGDNVEEEKLDKDKTNEEEEMFLSLQVLKSVTTLPPPPIPLVQPQQQTPVPTSAIVPNNLSKFKQTNLFAEAVSSIPVIVDTYLSNKMIEAIKTDVQLQSDRLRDEAQAENEDFINKLDKNIKKIIKEQVKVQVKEQVSKILPRIKKFVNEKLKAEVLTCSSNKAKTSHVVAANLSEIELKKILIDKIEINKLIHRSDQQKTLYKALIDAYETDKVILETYGDTVTIKRRRDDEDDDKEPSAGSNWGSKRKRAGKEPELTNKPKEKTSKLTRKYKEGSKSHQKSIGNQAEEPIHTAGDLEEHAL